jgi:quinoprotein glucose dehydrogenase
MPTRIAALLFVASQLGFSQGDWPGYAYDQAGQRYSPLAQITPANVAHLKPAWTYDIDLSVSSMDPATRTIAPTEAVPIVVGGVMYVPTMHRTIVALAPETGKELWKYTISDASASLRGLSYWVADKRSAGTIFAGLSDGRLIALNAQTGKLSPGFAKEGTLNLRTGVADAFPNGSYHMSSPGAMYKNLLITGAQGQEDQPKGPAMDIRAWDMRTGALVWTFHLFPHGLRIAGSTPGRPLPGVLLRLTWNADWYSCRSDNRRPNITVETGMARICSPPPSWLWMRPLGSSAGISSSHTTICGTTTPRLRRR